MAGRRWWWPFKRKSHTERVLATYNERCEPDGLDFTAGLIMSQQFGVYDSPTSRDVAPFTTCDSTSSPDCSSSSGGSC